MNLILEIVEYLEGEKRLPKPKDCSAELFLKIMECWFENAHERPCFFHLSIFMREYSVRVKLSNNTAEVTKNGFDTDWLHCYTELSKAQTRMVSHGSTNTGYESTNLV